MKHWISHYIGAWRLARINNNRINALREMLNKPFDHDQHPKPCGHCHERNGGAYRHRQVCRRLCELEPHHGSTARTCPGWQPELVHAPDGYILHQAPVGGYLMIRFRNGDTVTPAVPQAIMDNRNAAIPVDKITARDITDTHRRGVCMAAAFTFGLAYELWAKLPLESGYADSEPHHKEPDVASILRSISKSQSMDVLKTNYEAAMQMLAPDHHPAIKKAASARKAELAPQPIEETQ